MFALAVESGTERGREGDRKGTRRGESNNRAAWNLVMYTSPLVPWLIPVTGLLGKKEKRDSCRAKTLPVAAYPSAAAFPSTL